MARPRKDGLDYFPHDTDAANDEKVEALRMLYGNDGYAFYFILLERIYRTSTGEIVVSDAETKQILSRKVDVTIEKFEEMLKTALKRGCFDVERYEKDGILTSKGIKKRMEPVISKRLKMKELYQSSDSFCMVSDAETKNKPDKVKERKEKESIEKKKEKKHKYGEFKNVILSESEYEKLFIKFNGTAQEKIEVLSEYLARVGAKYKSHYLTILKWAKDDKKTKPLSFSEQAEENLRKAFEDG